MSSATLHSIRSRRLMPLARQHQLTRLEDAEGCCLSVSLGFALAARQQCGSEVDLIHWRVVGDPQFADHWAVAIDGGLVLDLTRVQVDGATTLLGSPSAYPSHFVRPRVYPASLLLPAYIHASAGAEPPDGRLPGLLLWQCRNAQLRFDLAAAWHRRDARDALAALRDALAFALSAGIQGLQRRLEQRRNTLMQRSSRLASAAAESSHSSAERCDVAARRRDSFG